MATTPGTPVPKLNRINLSILDYKGGKTTLCAGCGHNAISERILADVGLHVPHAGVREQWKCRSSGPRHHGQRQAASIYNAVPNTHPPPADKRL